MLTLSIDIAQVAIEDNEENALLALRIIFELHKAYRTYEALVLVSFSAVPYLSRVIFVFP